MQPVGDNNPPRKGRQIEISCGSKVVRGTIEDIHANADNICSFTRPDGAVDYVIYRLADGWNKSVRVG